MKIHPLFKWFGSKWSAAKLYPEPRYNIIVEPYAGSAGYCLNYADYHCVIYDSNEQLQKLWKWLIKDATQQDILDIPINLEIGTDIRTLGLSEGQALLLKNWQRTNNVGDCWTISKWGHLPGQWTANCRARVAEESQAIKHWQFREYVWDINYATFFIDPPYLYNYRYKVKDFDYERMTDHICSLRSNTQVIVCEATCPKTGAVPDYLPFQPFARRVTSRRAAGNHTHSNELIYLVDN